MRRFAAILAALALLAGCGGGGGNGDSDSDSGSNGSNGGTVSNGGGENEVGDQLSYDMGFQQCDGYSVNDLAMTYNTEQDAEAVADAVARTTPAPPETLDSVRQGCLDALEK
jgi:hypothetical protein